MLNVLLLMYVAAADVAASQPAETSDIFDILKEQEDLVTAGSRVAVKISESPSSVWLIDRKQIEASAATSIADVLRRVPGIVPVDFQSGDTQILTRGFGGEVASRPLFIVDGRSVNADDFGLANPLALGIDLDDIERIEVVIGPASTLYGANAYSAVINITTRSAPATGYEVHANVNGGIGWAGRAGGQDDPNGLQGPLPVGRAHVDYGQAFGDFKLRVAAGAQYLPTATFLNPQPRAATPIAPERIDGLIDGTYSFSGWTLRVQLLAQSLDNYENRTTISEGATTHYNDQAANLQLKKPDIAWKGDELLLQAWVRRESIDNPVIVGDTAPPIPLLLSIWTEELLAQYSSPVFFFNRLLAGFQGRTFEAQRLGGTQVDPSGLVQGLFGLFVEDQFRPIQQLILNAGVRAETQEARAFKPFSRLTASPRGAVVYIPAPGHSLRAEVTTAYRNPSLVEAFYLEALPGNNVITYANPALQPERHLMTQLGYQGRIGWLQMRADFFYGQKSGLITLVPLIGAGVPYEERNVADTEYFGGSGQVRLNPIANLDLFAHYTFVETRARVSGQRTGATTAVVFTDAPQHSGAVGASYLAWKKLLVACQVYFQSSTAPNPTTETARIIPQPGRVIINPSVRYTIDERARWTVYVAGTNVGDIRIGSGLPVDYGVPEAEHIGARIWAGVELHLD